MTVVNPLLQIYAGDAEAPIVQVKDDAGNALDISTASEIVYTLKALPGSTTVLIEKRKSTSGITFVTDGTDGQFQVTIATGETAELIGHFFHQAEVIDANGAQITVMTGTVNILAH